MKHIQKGFTLIELMIVVAIIGILAALAIPAYSDYTARAQMSEAVELMSGYKAALAEYYADKGHYPTALTEVGSLSAPAGKYTSTIALVTAGAVASLTATMQATGTNANIASSTVQLNTANGGQTWQCTRGTVLAKYLPAACK